MNKSHILTKASFVFANLICILCFNKVKKNTSKFKVMNLSNYPNTFRKCMAGNWIIQLSNLYYACSYTITG